MRQIFILLCILGNLPAALAQNGNAAPVVTRYYFFIGTIDKYPVTFQLYRINDKFSGSYYYNSTEETIAISGEMGKDHFLKLTHFDLEGNAIEVLSGNFKDSSFSGTWEYKDKLLAFRVAQKKDNNGLAFDYIYTHGSKKLPPGKFNRDQLSYDAATVWPAPSCTHTATGFIKQLIYESFGEKDAKDEIGKVMISRKKAMLNQQTNEDEEVPTYAESVTVKVEYRNTQLLTLSEFNYTDVAGAHGMYGTTYTCVDLIHNRKLAIADVLDTLAGQTALQTLLAKKFRAAYHLKNDEKISDHIFTETIPASDNFLLTSKGIGFSYLPNELGAYALGEVFLYISFKDLDTYLKPEFKQLISGN